jgi:putrescine transport system ATP-binding protein
MLKKAYDKSGVGSWKVKAVSTSVKSHIVLEGVSKSFQNTVAINNVSLSITQGELFSLLGESGCGKSTLLRLLAGFESPSKGRIFIDGLDITDWPPYRRPVNMMFQSYALFPHMTAEENVMFGLKCEKLPRSEINDRTREIIQLVKMDTLRERYPSQLSGGQKQRVALARSLVKHPKVLLLDEPLGALDKKLREQTQFELINIQERIGITFVMVTHDQEEAMTMSSRIAVMEAGQIRQVGTPHEIYEFPYSRFVAEFIGRMNLLEGVVVEDGKDHVLIESQEAGCLLYVTHAMPAPIGATVCIGVRPEKIMLSLAPLSAGPQIQRNTTKGVVKEIAYLGNTSNYHIQLTSGKMIQAALPNLYRLTEREIKWDDEVHVFWLSENGILLPS